MTKIDELIEAGKQIERIVGELKGRSGIGAAFGLLLEIDSDELQQTLCDDKELWGLLPILIKRLLDAGPRHAPGALSYLTGEDYEAQMREWVDDPEEAESIRVSFVAAIETLQRVVFDLDELVKTRSRDTEILVNPPEKGIT